MANPKIGHGAKVQYSSDGGTTWNTVKGVTSDGVGSSKADVLETTSYDTAGHQKTFVGGLFDPGDYTLKVNAIPGDVSQSTIRGWAGDGIAHLFQVIDSSNIESKQFNAFVVSFDESNTNDKIGTRDLKMKVSAAITYGAASAPSALSYTTPVSFVHGTPITELDPTVSGMVDSYAVSPALPTGMVLDTVTGIISGTPASVTAAADYVVTATNTKGTTTATVHITVT
jgi:hypothetical protein